MKETKKSISEIEAIIRELKTITGREDQTDFIQYTIARLKQAHVLLKCIKE